MRGSRGRGKAVVAQLSGTESAGSISSDTSDHDVPVTSVDTEQFTAAQLQPRSPLEKIIVSGRFELLCSSVIVCNTVYIGYATDRAMQYAITGEIYEKTLASWVIDVIFWGWYSFELVLRLVGLQERFFCGPQARWNYLDLGLAISSTVDIALGLGDGNDNSSNVSFLRIVRLLKIMKMLRLVRVMRFFRPLRLMLYQIVGSGGTLFWTFIMLGLIMYVFGVGLVMGVSEYVGALSAEEKESSLSQDAIAFWGGVLTAMQSLLEAITGGNDWAVLAAPLKVAGLHWYLIFLLYLLFLLFAVLNVLTGVFVDAAVHIAAQDQDSVASEIFKSKSKLMKQIEKLFEDMDINQDGNLTKDEFFAKISCDTGHAALALLEIDQVDAEAFFLLLSEGQSGVSVHEFIEGCTRLKGSAKSADLIAVLNLVKHITKKVDLAVAYLSSRLAELDNSRHGHDPHTELIELYHRAGLPLSLPDGPLLNAAKCVSEASQDGQQRPAVDASLSSKVEAVDESTQGVAEPMVQKLLGESLQNMAGQMLADIRKLLAERLAEDIAAALVPHIFHELNALQDNVASSPHLISACSEMVRTGASTCNTAEVADVMIQKAHVSPTPQLRVLEASVAHVSPTPQLRVPEASVAEALCPALGIPPSAKPVSDRSPMQQQTLPEARSRRYKSAPSMLPASSLISSQTPPASPDGRRSRPRPEEVLAMAERPSSTW